VTGGILVYYDSDTFKFRVTGQVTDPAPRTTPSPPSARVQVGVGQSLSPSLRLRLPAGPGPRPSRQTPATSLIMTHDHRDCSDDHDARRRARSPPPAGGS
jgi:L-ascorbate metabolism protein UlaG (beta-lactamase superfamily)